ncbi:DedA family protein, partial [Pseudonocardia lacus]|uniref:DedA family protein n=1 Tax=Pseudonocardia lacus TaxID=2835865 RepID=UPI001BDBC475
MSTVPVAADGGIIGWVVGLMETLGAPGVGLAIALESVFPPLPSEVFLPLAGFTAARGDMSLVAAIVWTTLGSLAGALALYGVGAALGRERLLAIADRMPLVDVKDVVKAEEWFARHGSKAVFFGRMVPLVRSLVSVPAGLERMPLVLFAALTTAGSLIWNTAFVLAGYGLGANFGLIEPYMSVVSKVVVGLLAVAVGWWVARRVLARRRADSDDEPAEAPAATDRPAPVAVTPAVRPARPSAPERVPDATRLGLPRVGSFDDVETVRMRVPPPRVDTATVRLDRRGTHPPAPPRRVHPAPHPHPHARPTQHPHARPHP